MPFTPYTLPISLTAVATGGGVTPKSMSGLRGKTVYDSGGTSYTLPASGNFSLKDNFLNRSFTTFPGSPTNLSATAGNAQATLSWSAPTNNGGSAITGYTIKYSNGTFVTTTGAGTTSYTVTGLTNGTSYTFIVTANNSVGSSTPSSFPSVTPVAPVNNLYIESAQGIKFFGGTGGSYTITPPGRSLSYAVGYDFNGDQSINFVMTGGNSSPVYIYFNTSSFSGTTEIIVNNVNYGNNGGTAVYFPYGIVNATATHTMATNGGAIYISATAPSDYNTRNKGYQNASGNAITWP
jgi:hypothetical protein